MPNSNSRRHLGRQPSDPRKPRLRLTRAPRAALDVPVSADWLSEVRDWPMLSNDLVGDCTAAAAGHVAQAVNWYGQSKDAPVTDADAIDMYSAICGYDPRRPSTDVGATLLDACDYWRKTGIGGNQIAAFAEIDPSDLDLVRYCIATFGTVYCGMSFPSSGFDQLDAGKPWKVVKRSAIEGGHCVPIGAYDDDTFTCTTWGQVQAMDLDFYERYFDEIVVPVDLDWMRAVGTSPSGLDTAALNSDYESLTGDPGPFPIVVTPPPVNPPAGDDADTKFLAAVEQLETAAAEWRTAKGL